MARSIHDTWGELLEARQSDWSDPDIQEATIAELRANLRRQTAVRTSERRRRQHGPARPQESSRRLGRFVPDLERSILAAFDRHPFTRAWAERLRRASASRVTS